MDGLCELSKIIAAVVKARANEVVGPIRMKDKRLKRLVKQLLPALQAMAWCLAPLGRAVKLFETGSLSCVLQTMATIQGAWAQVGATTTEAHKLLDAVYKGTQHFSGTVGHRNNMPEPKKAGTRLNGYYSAAPAGAAPRTRGEQIVGAVTEPVPSAAAAATDTDELSFAPVVVPTEFGLLQLEGDDKDDDLKSLPELPELPDTATLRRTFATALLAALMSYGFDVETLARCTSSSGRLYTRAALANPQWDIVHAINDLGLEPAVVTTVKGFLAAEEDLLRQQTTTHVTTRPLSATTGAAASSPAVATLSHKDIGDQLFNRATAMRPVPITESEYTTFTRARICYAESWVGTADLDGAVNWWIQRRDRFPFACKVLLPLVLASASSSDSERAGSTTQSIIGTRATQMGHEALKVRTLLKANLPTALAIARRRASPILLGGGLELSRSATLVYPLQNPSSMVGRDSE